MAVSFGLRDALSDDDGDGAGTDDDDQGLAEIVLDGLVGKEVTDAIPRGEARRRAFWQLVATPVLDGVAAAFREPGFDDGADYVHEHAHD